MDFMDLIVDSADEFLTGYFYKKRPKTQADGRIQFNYRQLDPNSRVFGKVLGEVRADRASYAIRTNDMCGFNIGGYIVTQNGLIWQITEVITNEESKGSNDALRWFKKAVNAECSLRMVQIDNLYDIDDAYLDICEIKVTIQDEREKTVTAFEGAEEKKIEPIIDGSAYVFEVRKGSFVVIKTDYGAGEEYTRKIPANKTVNSELRVAFEK